MRIISEDILSIYPIDYFFIYSSKSHENAEHLISRHYFTIGEDVFFLGDRYYFVEEREADREDKIKRGLDVEPLW